MNVLVACEFSGQVRDAFVRRGHVAVSCDFLPTETPGEHIQGDVMASLHQGWWDLVVAFPPCTHLAVSGARWWPSKQREQAEAIEFARAIMECGAPRIAVENPVGRLSSAIRKPDQIVQPWMFGHGETKATCLWLKGLPPLVPTNVVDGRVARVHRESPGPERWKKRSRTLPGVAEAMAAQWGQA